MKRIILSLVFTSYFLSDFLIAQNIETYNQFLRYNEFYKSGDFLNAEKSMLNVLTSNDLPEEYIVASYNNLGATCFHLGEYKEALDYYAQAETLITRKKSTSAFLADIYINEAIIYGIKKSYQSAIDYFEKAIRIYQNLNQSDKNFFQNLSSAYLNLGVVYYEIKNFTVATAYFKNSADLKLKYNLTGLALVHMNIAKIFVKTGEQDKAEEYFLRSISVFKKEYGEDYFRLAEVYHDYGLFLRSTGRYSESLGMLHKALSICLKNYSDKHTLTSLSYKLIGDHFVSQNSYDSAFYFYQKSLIAVVNDFNNPDISTNPSIDSAIFNIRLLDNLKSKARALLIYAGKQNAPKLKLKTTQTSLATIELAMQLIDRIRNSYLSEESRIYLAENEKETYLFATDVARNLFSMTNEKSAVVQMYDIAKKAKAAVLRNEINENDFIYSAGIPDSLRNLQNKLSGNISAYNNLIQEEMKKKNPDNKKISIWKDALFEMNRENEKASDKIDIDYPQYHDLLQKTRPVTLSEIQRNLNRDETVIDYLLSNQYSGGKRKMYIFLITREQIEFRENDLDSLFVQNLAIISKHNLLIRASTESVDSFRDYTASLFYMYENLIRPVESLIRSNRLIIIPDEEIGQMVFDTFLKTRPDTNQTDYEGLHYLINYYAFSFGYSSSLIFRKSPEMKRGKEVYAFSPDYSGSNVTGNKPGNLPGATHEIDAVLRLFRGRKFSGDKATETNFREALQHPAIFHLAMHSISDSSDSRYSYMMFDPQNDKLNDGKLYNYEISLSRIKSPMVVLSACNSGIGTLYHGEGLMSLARGFILSGASSVIKTAWEVNDEASVAVITRFYYHLSKGNTKDVAMRLAKLDYIKSSSPAYSDPYYWAPYEVLGDSSGIPGTRRNTGLIITVFALTVAIAAFKVYFKRRRIFRDRSL